MEDIVLMVENLPEITDETITLDKSNQMQLRKDEVKPSLRREEIVKNAPSTEAGCFVVPRVLD
ncbi:MAG: aspartyl/glutamyl-tRNA amidotransferase subunit C [Oscillospiraceae bacterium]|nr:aspartyl/glutamyl-tRNA amidotransferase subunit C [Oscillospiraceae bacterium]